MPRYDHMPYQVIQDPDSNEWVIGWSHGAGTGRSLWVDKVIERFDRKSDALDRAEELAANQNAPGVVVHDSDGKVMRFEANLSYWIHLAMKKMVM